MKIARRVERSIIIFEIILRVQSNDISDISPSILLDNAVLGDIDLIVIVTSINLRQ